MTLAASSDASECSSSVPEDLSNNQVFIDQLNAASLQLAKQKISQAKASNDSNGVLIFC